MPEIKLKPRTSVSDKIWKFFASLRLTILLFTLLTLSVLIGSFIIQKQFAQDGQIEAAYSATTIRVLEFFGMFDLYHSAWFVFLLFLFGVNNVCASIEMWPRHRKLSRHEDPLLPLAAFANQNFHATLPAPGLTDAAVAKIAHALKKFFKAPQISDHDGGKRFYVNKNPWSHFGVYVVHVGVILVLLGGVLGSVGSFEGQMQLSEGESSNQVFIRNRHNGKTKLHLDFQVKCHDIRIETYENGSPKDYFSDLEILDKNGNSLKRGTIQVNQPLEYGGISFYQATYGSKKNHEKSYYDLLAVDAETATQEALVFPTDAQEIALAATGQSLRFVTYKENLTIPLQGGSQETGEFLGLDLVGPGSASEKLLLFKDIPQADTVYRPDARRHFVFRGLREDFELQEVTGLQVAKDPGAPAVFAGAAILLLGVMITFFTSHQKVWLHWQQGVLRIAGKTHRNPWAFGKKFEALVSALKNISND